MKKVLSVLVVLMMVLAMVACAAEPVETTTEPTTEPVTELATEPTTQPTTETTKTSATIEKFWETVKKLDTQRMISLGDFSKNPEITQAFLGRMGELNELYDEMMKFVYWVETGKYDDVSVEDYIRMERAVEYALVPMNVIGYDEKWDDAFCFGEYDSVEGWRHKYRSRYADGLYELSDGYQVSVEWSQNFTTDVTDHQAFDTHREYRVIDPTQDAYLLLYGVETGWQLVCILASESA